ncbi:peptidase G2 autoproteolytic cleavage domain-containing protein [Leisingera daeponensis]|uniref:peptidase G2 autoproteolytic cleavage domain-containing protein n=1 Tax=Leisingera daeponensis TaxID=405746 RepID=UPI0021BD49FB|nr:peptidase G2 autoproteolytic cleavage domain-containing protein [Leisingera daeponensis]
MFQSNWSGRAEMALAGCNDFSVKLSANGSSWSTALALKPNGRADLGTGNPGGEDRRGISVVLDGAKIRPARLGEEPIGVNRWLRDDYGAPLRNTDGKPQENPAYDPSRTSVPRRRRPEWTLVGLVGKLRLRKSQPAATGWIRMRQVSPDLKEWLVR